MFPSAAIELLGSAIDPILSELINRTVSFHYTTRDPCAVQKTARDVTRSKTVVYLI